MFQKKIYHQILALVLAFTMLFCAVPALKTQASAIGKVTLKSAAATSKSKIKIKWKKLSKAAGYQVSVSKSKNGKNPVFTKTTKKNAVTTGKLPAGTYYVKVRAYQTVSGSKKYGTWSSVKKVKINAETQTSTVSNTIAVDKEALKINYADKFSQETYTDSSTGLSVTYNLFLPENYDASKSYPLVVFIADSSCTGNDATVSLTQGRGGLVWAASEWQAAHPTIVAVPTYPETILDDHGSYTTTEYVELTKRLIDAISSEYAVDTNRIYGTGQSMGCMTTLILASEYPNLYAACMFVDGQWDVTALKGLEGQKFVYFAAEDDTNAYNGMQEVMEMFKTDSASYTYKQWNGSWTPDQLSDAAKEIFSAGTKANFISWKTGTIEAKSGMGSGGMGENNGARDMQGTPAPASGGAIGGPSPVSGGAIGGPSPVSGGAIGGANSSSYHMASFDYAYNCIAVMEWLMSQ